MGTGGVWPKWPLTAAQQEIRLAHELDETGVRSIVGGYVHIHGRIDADLFERAVRIVVAGSETLRVRIDGNTQIVEELPDWPLERDRFRTVAEAERWLYAELHNPFDLGTAPLFEQRLLDVGEAGYLWFVKAHHIVLDGASFIALLRRVAGVYTELSAGREVVSEVFDRVETLVAQDNHYRESERFAADRKFWSDRLADMPEAPMFAEGPGRSGPTAYLRHTGDLAASDWRDLRELGERWEVGWPALVLSAAAILLHADTGARTVALGLAVPAKRSRTALGMTANVVPLRLDVDPADTVAALARAARAESLSALRHQRYRLADMLADVHAAGGERRIVGPVVNILPRQQDVLFGPYPATLHDMSAGRTEDFTISVYEGLPRLRVAIDSTTARFRKPDLAAQHKRFLSALRALARASEEPAEPTIGRLRFDIAAGADTPPGSTALPHGPNAPRRTVVVRPHDPMAAPDDVEARRTLVSWFAHSVRTHGRNPALTCGAETLTYAELDERSDLLARRIAAAGVGPGAFVAIALPRSAELVVGIVAVLKTGAAYVPVDPANPVERIRMILDDCAPALVVTTSEMVLPTVVAPILAVDEPGADIPAEPVRLPRPADPAYVIYTSGSTGKPKGVLVTHANVVRLFTRTEEWFGFGSTDVWTLFHSVAFDFSVWEIWGALLYGGRLVVVDTDTARSPADFRHLLAAESVTVLNQTPSAFGMLVDADASRPASELAVRWVILGGEAIEPHRVTAWYERHPDRPVVDMYGATETTVFTTGYVIDARTPADIIGRPIPDLKVYLLDAALRPVPDGVPGELYIAGPGVAGAYLRRRGLTAARFVADPVGPPGALMYRSGDIARRVDGMLEYLGRVDRQVKIRGFRIERGEVEAALHALPEVSAAAVLVDDTPRLIAYVVSELDTEVIRDRIAATLPAHALPSAVVAVPELPLTGNGKLDERRLLAIRPSRSGDAIDRPRTDLQKRLHRLFAETLGRDDFGIDDRFFAIGGDSIQAIRLVDRARTDGLAISAKDVFEYQTVRALAGIAASVPDAVAAQDPSAAYGAMPATPIMERLARSGTTADDFAQYTVIRLPAAVTEPVLLTALQALLDHHDALRMRAEWTAREGWRVEIPEPGSVRAQTLLRRVVSTGSPTQLVEERLAAQRRLVPRDGVMVQAVRFAGAESDLLLLTIHHLVVDDVSWRILLSDLERAISGSPLEPVPAALRVWAERIAQQEISDEEAQWWRTSVGSAATTIGHRRPDPGHDRSTDAVELTDRLDPDSTHTLLTVVSHRFRADVTELLLAALAVALARWQGAGPVLVDIARDGRDIVPGPDVSRTVGRFTVSYPMVLDAAVTDWDEMLSGRPELVRAVRAVVQRLRSVPNHGLGYGLLCRGEAGAELGPRAPLGFTYLGRFDPSGTVVEPESFGGPAGPETAYGHELDLVAHVDAEGGLCTHWIWPAALFDRATITELTELWAQVLSTFVRHHRVPGTGVHIPSDFPLVRIDQEVIDRIERHHGAFTDLLPTTPMQAGMLFHSFYETASDPYAVQLLLTLRGDVDVDRLRRAARTVLRRHPQLTGAFVVRGVERPLLVLPADPSLPVRVVEAAGPAADDTVDRLAREDLRALDPEVAPLFRIAVVHIGPGRWRLVFSFHHALLDGWSTGNVLRELLQSYHGIELEPAPSYRSALERFAAEDHEDARRAWAEELRGVEPIRFGRSGPTGPAEPHMFSLDPTTSTTLTATAAAHGVTLNSLIQAVWALALGYLTGSSEVVFGVTVSGRDIGTDTEGLVGMLMNTVPLRVRVDPAVSVVELAMRIQSRRSALLEHDHLGLGDILAAAGDVGELFDTALIFENFPLDMAAFTDPTAELSVLTVDYRDRTHYPLAVTVFPGPVLRFRLGIRPGQVDWFGTAEDIWSVLSGLCAAVANRPHDPVGRIRIPAPGVLDRRSGVSVTVPDRTVAEVFETTAAVYGARTALWCAGTEITYGELNARANRFARRLARLGVGAGTPVGIALPRSPELVVAFLAVLKLGAVCLPIHDGYPPERVEWLLRHTGAELVLRDIGADENAAAELPDTNPGTVVASDAPAWLMFTSGSTGTPKGVQVTHRNIVARALDRIGHGNEHRRLLLHSPYTWDMVVYELWMPLLTGHSVAIAPPGPLVADDYREVIDRGSVTSILISAGLFQVLAEAMPAELARVEHIAIAGDVPAPAAIARVRAARPAVAVTNLYGPVETTAFALAHRIPCEPVDDRPVPIGAPVDNTGVAVLDSALRPVPVEVAGEIYLSGAGVAGGYMRQPALSAARFVANPYGRPGTLMYRTGDLGRWDADGRLHFLGRADRQQKINGFRVEPGEVEAAIRQDPDIAAAVVTARQSKTGKSLVAYVVGRDRRIDPVRVRARLAETLPSYLVPAVVVPLDELPLTPNGKVDIAALPLPESTSSGAVGTQRQQVLASVVAGVLGVDEIGVDEDFFAAGGNSLSAIRLVDAVNTTFEAGITLRDLFEHPTVAGLDHRLDTADPARSRPPLVPRRHTEPVPLTPTQQRLWTINYLSGGQADYLMPQAVEIDGPLDIAALRAAVADVIARHEILRTVLPYLDHGPVQRVLPAPAVDSGVDGAHRISGIETYFRVEDRTEEDLSAMLAAELERGFDVRTQVPLRTVLFRLGETRHVFLIVVHHIAGDAESLVRLSQELVAAYTARVAGHAPEWPMPAVQFADYTLWLRDLMGEESDPTTRAAAQARYWLAELAGLPESPLLPTDHPRTERVDNRAEAVPLSLDAATHRAIVRIARECSASTYLILHTAFVCVLAEFGAGHDIPVGVMVSGRDHEALDRMIGCAVHTVVLRADTSGAPTYRQLVVRLRDRLLGATEHKEFPFDRLVTLLNPPRSRHHYPLFQVASTFYRDIVTDHSFGGATARLLPLPPQRTEFDLLLQLRDGYTPGRGPAGIGGELVYAAELFERATIEKMADRMRETLGTICADIDAPIRIPGSGDAVREPVSDGTFGGRR